MASSSGLATRVSRCSVICSNCSLFIDEVASTSFMRDSTLSGASAFALKTFFSLSHPVDSRNTAFGEEMTSILYFVLNSSEKCWTRA